MSQVILWEVHFLLKSMILGLGLRGAYDVFKLRRALTRRHPALLAAEDTVYWMLCSLFVFGLLYEENNGTLRGFALCGVAAGMWYGIWTQSDPGGRSGSSLSVFGENPNKTRENFGKSIEKSKFVF